MELCKPKELTGEEREELLKQVDRTSCPGNEELKDLYSSMSASQNKIEEDVNNDFCMRQEDLDKFKEDWDKVIKDRGKEGAYTYTDTTTSSTVTVSVDVLSEKERLVEKLLKSGAINIKEAMLLLKEEVKTVYINNPLDIPLTDQNPYGSPMVIYYGTHPYTPTTVMGDDNAVSAAGTGG